MVGDKYQISRTVLVEMRESSCFSVCVVLYCRGQFEWNFWLACPKYSIQEVWTSVAFALTLFSGCSSSVVSWPWRVDIQSQSCQWNGIQQKFNQIQTMEEGWSSLSQTQSNFQLETKLLIAKWKLLFQVPNRDLW